VLNLPVLRWGKPYESLDVAEIHHFHTGEPIAKVSQANGGLLQRDLKKAGQARAALREIPAQELIAKCKEAADRFTNDTLAVGDGQQSADDFVKIQSASTGLPENMCRGNMEKVAFVLARMDEILDALTRGLDLDILTRGYGHEERGVTVSYQVQTPVLGAVLPSNSPGVHTLWLPAIPLQIGLVLKPGSSEPWTPYRVASALMAAGVPEVAFGLYPGGHDVGSALLTHCQRGMMFGSQQTVEQYAGNPRVQVHGPGFSKILIGDDQVDQWEKYLDVMVESVLINGGRSCINCSGIWASRHTKEIAAAIAARIGPVDVSPPDDDAAQLAAFTVPGSAQAIWKMIEGDIGTPGVTDMTADFGERFSETERCGYLRPVVLHCDSPESPVANKEFMFPFVSVVQCPQEQMLKQIGPTLVGTAITADREFAQALTDSNHIDRLNVGPIPTNRVNWLQPHEGNIIDFLFRSRAYQVAELV
jgi:acyl-CoA reductase-like NAD-dependent aldehyde dehydrogenase